MEQTALKTQLETVFFSVFFALLFINTFGRSSYEMLAEMSAVTIDISLVLLGGTLIFSWIGDKQKRHGLEGVYISFLLLIAFLSVSYWFTQRVEGSDLTRMILLAIFIIGSIRMQWRPLHIKIAAYITSGAVLFYTIHWLLSGMPMFFFSSIYRNENFLAAVGFSTLFFIILGMAYSHHKEKLYFGMTLVCNLLLIFTTSGRAVFLGVFVILVAWGILTFRRRWFKFIFYVFMPLIFMFMFVYTNLKGTWLGNHLNDLSREIFNKMNLFSGRSELWGQVWELFTVRPLFGYGLGTSTKGFGDVEQTAHNLYLQIMVEVGLVGMILFIIFLMFIWKALCRRTNVSVAKWSALFMLGILFYETLELTIHPNMYSIAMFQWLILTIGIQFKQPESPYSMRMDKHLRKRL